MQAAERLEQDLCKRIERLRLDRNMSQAKLAEQAGVARRTISRMENGEGVSLNTLLRVMVALGVSDQVEQLVPLSEIQPIARVSGKPPRKRASSPKTKEPPAGPWKWNDE